MCILYGVHAKFLGELQERVRSNKTAEKVRINTYPANSSRGTFEGM
jgi:hypothetical protein